MTSQKYAGRSGRRWRRLATEARRTETHCYRCGMPLDRSIPYRDPFTGAVNPDYVSAEHMSARSTHPHLAEDAGNISASHLSCNQQAGDRDNELSLGELPQDLTG